MELTHSIPWSELPEHEVGSMIEREWLLTNGLGGYASGTITGAVTRRYHGLLVAALPAPLGRHMMFNHLSEEVKLEDRKLLRLSSEETEQNVVVTPTTAHAEFQLEAGLPVWRYRLAGCTLEKRVLLPHMQNTVLVFFRVLQSEGSARLRLRPGFHFRPHDCSVDGKSQKSYRLIAIDDRLEIHSESAPPLRLFFQAQQKAVVLDGGRLQHVHYRKERARGYPSQGTLWSPGYFRADLNEGEQAVLVASTEEWDAVAAMSPDQLLAAERQRRASLQARACEAARDEFGAQLVLAADQFLVCPSTRTADIATAQASGDEALTVIAGYHWFTDWGRDTMISLEGLTLLTGRHPEAGYLLRTFGRYARDGLIPNLFPEGEKDGLYHTADATLWYFHALDRYVRATNDTATLQSLLPTLHDMIDHQVRGTRFGIHVDPADGLLAQGEPGYQLTWMDAKVGDWVVTPRRGKAVEINALWYNALRLLERWCHDNDDPGCAGELSQRAEQVRTSFNERFWFDEGGYLYDVVDGEDGDDASLRPNQIFAFSLEYPVLAQPRWRPVLDKVTDALLTPVGLRSLSPDHPDFKARYDGDLRARDAAYHQGTVWAWLIGPYIDARLRVYPRGRQAARKILAGFQPHLEEACVGSISEVFDAQAPFTPRGCIAQAWSVAEVLRAWVKTADRTK